MTVKFRHIAFANLVSAFSWTRPGRSSAKDYLPIEMKKVRESRDMKMALEAATDGDKSLGEIYHAWKNILPTLWETNAKMFPEHAQETPSKYHSFVGVITGLAIGLLIGFGVGVIF